MINEHPNGVEITTPEKTYTLSSLDKLDWTDKIELQMWYCVRTEGIIGIYHKEVIRLESCVKTDFAGLDFGTPIQKNIDYLDKISPNVKKRMIHSVWNEFNYNPLTMIDLTPKDRDLLMKRNYLWYWKQRFIFVRDIFAANRGLMWGRKSIPGGKQMED